MSNIKLAQQAIMKQETRFKEIAPDMAFQKEMMYAMQAMSNNSYLASTDPKSIASAVLGVAMSGLTLNPVLGHGYLVPRKGKAVFQPGYQGLIYLLIKSGIVKQVEARAVHENDDFSLEYGTETKLAHKPTMKNKGDVIGFYAIATDKNDCKYIEYMGKDEVLANAMRSDMNKKNGITGAWQTDFVEMGRKTAIRRLFKYLPKHTDDSSFLNRLTEAIGGMDAQQAESVKSDEVWDIEAEVLETPISSNGAAVVGGISSGSVSTGGSVSNVGITAGTTTATTLPPGATAYNTADDMFSAPSTTVNPNKKAKA